MIHSINGRGGERRGGGPSSHSKVRRKRKGPFSLSLLRVLNPHPSLTTSRERERRIMQTQMNPPNVDTFLNCDLFALLSVVVKSHAPNVAINGAILKYGGVVSHCAKFTVSDT